MKKNHRRYCTIHLWGDCNIRRKRRYKILQLKDSTPRCPVKAKQRATMNCNRYGISTTWTGRCKSCFEQKKKQYLRPTSESEMYVPVRIQKQRTSLLLFLVSFTVVCYLGTWVLEDGDASFRCSHVVHALVIPNAAVRHSSRMKARIGSKRITNMQLPKAVIFPSMAPLRRDGLVQTRSRTISNQQSNGSLEIDRDDANRPMTSTATKKRSSTGTEVSGKSSRRWFLVATGTTTGLVATKLMLPPSESVASASSMEGKHEDGTVTDPVARAFEYTEDRQTAVTIPLAFTGQELLIAYKVDGSKFKAVLDTGSPFLMIPGSCGSNTRQKSGCYQNQGTPVAKLTPTIEIFDGFQGEVNWRSASFEFWDVNNNDSISNSSVNVDVSMQQMQTQQQLISRDIAHDDNNLNSKKRVIFGVASEAIMGGPGGVFFGMIRDTDIRIRPSFLGQTDVRAFRVNLATRPRTLTLSNRNLVASDRRTEVDGETMGDDYIPMTNLLRRRYGDPVGHYTALAQSIYVNGHPLVDTTIDKSSKILVIFDTGVTGMVVSRGLFDEQYMLARKRREKTLFGDVELTFSTALRKANTLRATKPLATPFDPEQTWKKFPKRREGKKNSINIIVLGLAFLEGRSLTVDIDEERLWVE